MDAPLTDRERETFLHAAVPYLQAALPLVRYRNACRAADLANRECPGPNARRIEFAHEQYLKGRLHD
jgi:hypothetical protein